MWMPLVVDASEWRPVWASRPVPPRAGRVDDERVRVMSASSPFSDIPHPDAVSDPVVTHVDGRLRSS